MKDNWLESCDLHCWLKYLAKQFRGNEVSWIGCPQTNTPWGLRYLRSHLSISVQAFWQRCIRWPVCWVLTVWVTGLCCTATHRKSPSTGSCLSRLTFTTTITISRVWAPRFQRWSLIWNECGALMHCVAIWLTSVLLSAAGIFSPVCCCDRKILDLLLQFSCLVMDETIAFQAMVKEKPKKLFGVQLMFRLATF